MPHVSLAGPPTSVLADRIVERIADLLEPKSTRTARWVRKAGVDHLVHQRVVVKIPPLVQLLRTPVAQSAHRGAPGPRSRPPMSLEGVDCLRTMTSEAGRWASLVLGDMLAGEVPAVRARVVLESVEDSLRVLAHFAANLDREDALGIDRDLRRWWATARVVTTWDVPPLAPFVPCPACQVRGRLRVVDAPLAMVCLECHESWDSMSVGELGTLYELAFARQIEDPAAMQVEVPGRLV